MYKLENNVEWTTELKNAFKHNVTRAKIIWSGAEINEQNNLKDITLQEQRYIPNFGFIGTTIARMVEVNLLDLQGAINLENQEFTYKLGADYNGNTYYINYGNFIVDKPPENDETNGTIRVVAYDYMIKFNKPYVNRIPFPCTLLQLLQDVCSQAEVGLGTTDFPNKNFVVQDNQFEGSTLRDVLQNIAKCAFSWARIGQDNKLYLDFSLTPENTEEITIDDYLVNSFKKANEYYGPVNQVTYADSDITGQEARVKDQESIDLNGLKELVIYDNLFAYTPAKRTELIQAGIAILGLTYMPVTQLDLIGLAYLDCRDAIQISTIDENTYTTRIFNHTIKYNGTLHDSIVTEGTSNSEEAYKNTATDIFQNMQTRIIVDKANKTITSVVEEVNTQNNKISQITQTVDELNSKISDIADITTSQESVNGKVLLENINESEPITIRVHPTGSNISYLYPRTNLYPSSSLFMTTRTLRFTNLKEYRVTGDSQYTSYKRYYSYDGTDYTLLVLGTDYDAGDIISGTIYENEYIDYEIPMNLLWYDADNYDEFLLDYDSETCQVRKKVQYNADGTTSLMAEEVVYTFNYPHISLNDGDYEIELLGYAGAYLFVRLISKNIYTSQYVLKTEMNSEINQTKSEINASVDQKLTGYSTTSEMNSAINIKANQITSSVSETYETKSNATTNYSRLTQTANSLQSQINSNDTDISTLQQTASSLQSQINSNDTDISTLQQTASGLTSTVSQKVGKNEVISTINQSAEAVAINANKISLAGKTINMTSDNIAINSTKFSVDKNGNLACSNATITGGNITMKDNGSYDSGQIIAQYSNNSNRKAIVFSNGLYAKNYSVEGGYYPYQFFVQNGNSEQSWYGISGGLGSNNANPYLTVYDLNASTTIYPNRVVANGTTYNSRESMKKNIKLYNQKALDIIKASEIYEYNYKSEEDSDKKHIGFVIADEGGNYKTPEEIISAERDGIEQYNMTSILWKAIQEQQKEIEELKERLEGKENG